MTTWNPSRTFPTEVGEYHAVLDPHSACPSMRRYWNGQYWSSPYSIKWPQHLQDKCKKESCIFQPAWLSKEDTDNLPIPKNHWH